LSNSPLLLAQHSRSGCLLLAACCLLLAAFALQAMTYVCAAAVWHGASMSIDPTTGFLGFALYLSLEHPTDGSDYAEAISLA
jgi:hypothetical protein